MKRSIVEQPQEIAFPEVVERPVKWGYDKDLHGADGYKAIVNPDTGKLFSIVSKDYKLIRHEEAIEKVEKAIGETANLGQYEIRTEFYNGGGRMRCKYKFPKISVEIEQGDEINPELQLFNSYDKTYPFIVILGAYRVVCTNGLVVERKYLHLKKWKQWSGQRLTVDVYEKVVETMKFGKKASEEIHAHVNKEAEGFDDKGFAIMSLWIFFNILTWYITHRAVSLNHRVEMEKRLRAALGYLIRR